ncbi:MAG TPA: M28 family peptidase [Pirellulales bacterium]|jgi:hypothetical protein|nr:M28 family peptidase [Pirellulales bacterium]
MTISMRAFLRAGTAWCFVVALWASAARAFETKSLKSALDSISVAELRHHVEVLANDTFEGRAAGTRGGRAAAGYLAEQFKRYGLKPAGRGNNSYYQPFGAGFQNILGVLEGSDPALKHEYIIIGAHYDHVGYGTSRNSNGPVGYIHNGADDNASGDATLLEVLEGLTKLDTPPKRSILFALWDCEEADLNGSRHWLSDPTVPRERVVFAFNMDMVGRLAKKPLEIIGTRSAVGLRRFVAEHNDTAELPLDFTWELKRNSDHYSFYSYNIPILFIHTGLHNDYHRPSDDAEKLNYDGMRSIARLVFELVYWQAEADNRPKFRDASRGEGPGNQRSLEAPIAPAAGRLGIRWDDAPDGGPGLHLTQVYPGTAAARAGLRIDDRLLEFEGVALDAQSDLRSLVLAAPAAVRVRVRSAGEESPREIPVELDGKRVRLGISWHEDAAEPGTLIVVHVIPSSRAERAGIRQADRIYRVNGEPFHGGAEFAEKVAKTTGSFNLTLERFGRLVTVEAPESPHAAGQQ